MGAFDASSSCAERGRVRPKPTFRIGTRQRYTFADVFVGAALRIRPFAAIVVVVYATMLPGKLLLFPLVREARRQGTNHQDPPPFLNVPENSKLKGRDKYQDKYWNKGDPRILSCHLRARPNLTALQGEDRGKLGQVIVASRDAFRVVLEPLLTVCLLKSNFGTFLLVQAILYQ